MNIWHRNFILLALMLAASGSALFLRPTHKIAYQGPAVDLKAMIPHEFGEWREETQSSAQIVNPQQKEVIDRIYKQTLSRTYVNAAGYRVMLSIAYGEDQRDSVELHYPEVCYPAQGFQVVSNRKVDLQFQGGIIPVRRLETVMGEQRREPVTYWTMIGKQAVLGGIDKKLAEMHFGLKGQIPDGLLFRISSNDPYAERAFALQKQFVENLIATVDPGVRQRISGLQ
jgi:EpsI family protein